MNDLRRKAEAARKMGLNLPGVMKSAKPGAVYLAKDKPIALPRERIQGAGLRTAHENRYVIILQAAIMNVASAPVTVLVVPCSSSSRAAGPGDYAVPATESAFPDKTTVAYATLLQPLLKSELVQHVGDLSDQSLLDLQTVALRNLGLIGQGMAPVIPQAATSAASGSSANGDEMAEESST